MMGVKTTSLLMALLLVTSSFAKPAQSPEPVKVEGGLLKDTVEDGLTIYRGIPYAAPPVGDLPVAGSSASAEMARRARGERVWPRMHAVEFRQSLFEYCLTRTLGFMYLKNAFLSSAGASYAGPLA
jgi:hypothetical protein